MGIDQEREISEIRELVEENHQILKKLHNRVRLQLIVSIVKWVIIIAITFGIYTFIQPMLEQLLNTYLSIADSAASIADIKNSLPTTGFDLKNLLEIFGK